MSVNAVDNRRSPGLVQGKSLGPESIPVLGYNATDVPVVDIFTL